MSNPKMADFSLHYAQKNITSDVAPHLISLVYKDYLSDQSDELSVTFEDSSGKWLRSWYPTQGDELICAIGYLGQPLTEVGKFEIDELGYSHKPSVISIKALTTGIKRAARTLKPKAYEKTTLAEIVGTVAGRLGLKLKGVIRPVQIERATQYQERDIEFLTRLAYEYRHTFKVVGDTLVFWQTSDLEAQPPVAAIPHEEVISARFRDKITNKAKVVKVTGYDTDAKKPKKQQKSGKTLASSDEARITVRNETDEQLAAKTDARNEEQEAEKTQCSLTVIGNPKYVAGNTVAIQGFGKLSGIYLINSSTHKIDRNNAYTTELELKIVTVQGEPNETDQTPPPSA